LRKYEKKVDVFDEFGSDFPLGFLQNSSAAEGVKFWYIYGAN
jgi:hypothetical protein